MGQVVGVFTFGTEVVLDGLNKGLDKAKDKGESSFKGLAKAAGTTLMSGLKVAAASAAVLAGAIGFVTTQASAAQNVNSQLNAVLQSTGGVAGVTADEANSLADAYAEVTSFSDEAVVGAESILLTFTNIKDDVFPGALETVLDMSQALGQDLKSSSIQLGKALQSPIQGIGALAEVGVNFTEEQKKVVTSLVETGQVAEAQALILAELQTEFGGSARAAGETFGGQLDILKNAFDDVVQEVGAAFLPILTEFVAEVGPDVIDMLEVWAEDSLPKLMVKLADFFGLMADGIDTLALLVTWSHDVSAAFDEQEDAVAANSASWEEYVDQVIATALAAGYLDESMAAGIRTSALQTGSLNGLAGAMGDAARETYFLTSSMFRSAQFVASSTATFAAYDDELERVASSTNEVATSNEAASESERNLEQELNDLSLFISGPLGTEYDNFIERQENLVEQADELNVQIQEMESRQYLTTAQKAELEALRGDYAENQQAIADNAAEHDLATKTIIFNLVAQRLAMMGLPFEQQFQLLNVLGQQWGLFDETTVASLGAVDGALAGFAEGATLQETIDKIRGISEAGTEVGENPVWEALPEHGEKWLESADTSLLPYEDQMKALALAGDALDEHPVWENVPEYNEIWLASGEEKLVPYTNMFGDLEGTVTGVNTQVKTMDKILQELDGAEFVVTLIFQQEGNIDVPGAASGANFVVPPGFTNDSFMLGLTSGERAIVLTPDQQRAMEAPLEALNSFANQSESTGPGSQGPVVGSGNLGGDTYQFINQGPIYGVQDLNRWFDRMMLKSGISADKKRRTL